MRPTLNFPNQISFNLTQAQLVSGTFLFTAFTLSRSFPLKHARNVCRYLTVRVYASASYLCPCGTKCMGAVIPMDIIG